MALAYFSTWTTYGTWLPGDQRCWHQAGRGVQLPDRIRELEAALRMTNSAVLLDPEQRQLVEKTIAEHCRIRGWTLHAVNCRSNHVHVLVTAIDRNLEIPREQFKAWCTRKLNEHEQARKGSEHKKREKWFTERGWDEYVDEEDSLFGLISYIRDGQSGDRY